jgi:hypothetical protein
MLGKDACAPNSCLLAEGKRISVTVAEEHELLSPRSRDLRGASRSAAHGRLGLGDGVSQPQRTASGRRARTRQLGYYFFFLGFFALRVWNTTC